MLFACLISAGNAVSRYAFSLSSNAWLEVQWYMFAAMVFFGAPYTLKVNGHVRVDVIYSALSERTRIWIDIVGVHPVPAAVLRDPALLHLAVVRGIPGASMKASSNAGGLIRWPVKLVLPVGFALMALQGVSELIKRIAALTDSYRLEYGYETPLQ